MASVEETQTSVDQSGGSSGGEFELWVIGPDVHHRVPLVAGTITVGRQEQCTIRLDHTSVSRLHLTVFISATGIHVEDINSRNGTLLNKVRLAHTTRYPLTPSDCFCKRSRSQPSRWAPMPMRRSSKARP